MAFNLSRKIENGKIKTEDVKTYITLILQECCLWGEECEEDCPTCECVKKYAGSKLTPKNKIYKV